MTYKLRLSSIKWIFLLLIIQNSTLLIHGSGSTQESEELQEARTFEQKSIECNKPSLLDFHSKKLSKGSPEQSPPRGGGGHLADSVTPSFRHVNSEEDPSSKLLEKEKKQVTSFFLTTELSELHDKNLKKKKSLTKKSEKDKTNKEIGHMKGSVKVKMKERKSVTAGDLRFESIRYNPIIQTFKKPIMDAWNEELKDFGILFYKEHEFYRSLVDISKGYSYNVVKDKFNKDITDDTLKKALKETYKLMLMSHQFFIFPIAKMNNGQIEYTEPTAHTKPHKIQLIKFLAEGIYGIVFLCMDVDTGTKYALKHFFDLKQMSSVTWRTSAYGFNDLRVLTESLKRPHKHLVTPLFVSFDMLIINGISYPFIPDVVFQLVNEVMPFHHIVLESNMYHRLRGFLRQILVALKFIHRHGVIHRDIGPINIFLESNDNIRLGDFGMAVDVKHRWSERPSLNPKVYAYFWRAPECFNRDSYSTSADIWALGATVLYLVTKGSIFEDVKEEEMFDQIKSYYQFMTPYCTDQTYPSKFQTVITQVDKLAAEANEQDSVPDFMDLLVLLLQYHPSKRITAIDALKHRYFKKTF